MLQVVAAAVLFWIPLAAQEQSHVRVSDLEQKINVLINSERQARNMKALVLDDHLSQIARAHSQDMVKRAFFSHVNPDVKAPRDRIRSAGYSCPKTVGENIFQNNLYSRVTITGNQKSYDWNSLDQIADSTVTGWMHSSGHRQNILQRAYSKTGIGVAIAGDGKVYITQLFCG